MDRIGIFINAAHGGIAAGVCWHVGYKIIKESEITLLFAQYLHVNLQKRGYNSIMLRNNNQYCSEFVRAMQISGDLEDVVLSLHLLADNDPEERGFEILYNQDEIKSRFMARGIVGNLLELVVKENIMPHKQGISPGYCQFITETVLPSVVINLGYITNEEDRNLLTSGGISMMGDAIIDYLVSDAFRGMILE